MEPVTHVILGPGKCFHGIDEKLTKFYRSIDPALPALVISLHHTSFGSSAEVRAKTRLWGLMKEAGLIEFYFDPNHRLARGYDTVYRFLGFHPNSDGWLGAWRQEFAVPLCGVVKPGLPVPIEEARARGMDFSMECAKKLGVYSDGRSPLVRVGQKFQARGFRHVLECEVCQREGVAKCQIFPLIATGQIESDVDPKLEELLG